MAAMNGVTHNFVVGVGSRTAASVRTVGRVVRRWPKAVAEEGEVMVEPRRNMDERAQSRTNRGPLSAAFGPRNRRVPHGYPVPGVSRQSSMPGEHHHAEIQFTILLLSYVRPFLSIWFKSPSSTARHAPESTNTNSIQHHDPPPNHTARR